jgi:hypothetical protein
MEIEAAIRRELLQDPTVAGYVGTKVYRRTLWDNLEVLQGARAIVVRRTTGWAVPQRKNTQEYPTVMIQCWADADRDASGNVTTDNGMDNAWAVYRAVDTFLHGKDEGIWGKFGSSPGLEVIGCQRGAEPVAFGPDDVSPDLKVQMDTYRYVQVPYWVQCVHGTLAS